MEALQEAEGEWTENKMVIVKNLNVKEPNSLKDLRDQINTLGNVITSNGDGSPHKSNGKSKNDNQNRDKKDGNAKNGNKSKGPETSSNGPFCDGQKPIQCYKCGRLGHKAHICPS